MNPSDIPWWGWFLCAVGAWAIAAIIFNLAEKADEEGILDYLGRMLFLAFAGAGIVAASIGIIRFIKWVLAR